MSKKEVDKYFPRNGPCMFHSTRYARHRLIDTIQARNEAGDSVAQMMRDYELSRAAVKAAINSTADDNRMTPKEIEDGKREWREFEERMKREDERKRKRRLRIRNILARTN